MGKIKIISSAIMLLILCTQCNKFDKLVVEKKRKEIVERSFQGTIESIYNTDSYDFLMCTILDSTHNIEEVAIDPFVDIELFAQVGDTLVKERGNSFVRLKKQNGQHKNIENVFEIKYQLRYAK